MGVKFNRILNFICTVLNKCDQFINSIALILYLSSLNVKR